MRQRYDAAVIGGGIIGTSAAAFLAGEGLSVVLFERDDIAAGASGRNSGVLQHPFDSVLAGLHRRTLELYLELGAQDKSLAVGARPAGLLMVGPDGPRLRAAADLLVADHPELSPRYIPADELRSLEPALAAGIGACRLETGHPVVPAAATHAYARRAAGAGVTICVGVAARPHLERGRASGVVLDDGQQVDARQVLLAAGPWTPALVPDWHARPPIRPTFGVVVATRLRHAPAQVLEEIGIDPSSSGAAMSFSLVTADGVSSVGSTFMTERPDPESLKEVLLEEGARYVPALAEAEVLGVRLCARPVSFDGRPLIGPIENVPALFVCAGHGPWGMSTGPASARLVADLMLDQLDQRDRAVLPAELAAGRYAGRL